MSEYNLTIKDARTGERFLGSYIIKSDIFDDDYLVVSQKHRDDFIRIPMNGEVYHEDPRYERWFHQMKENHSLLAKALVVCRERCNHEDDYAGLQSECTNPNCPVHVLFGKQPTHYIH